MNLHSSFSRLRILAVLAACALGHFFFVPAAFAQAPGGNEMCGDGTTFTVNLPGTTLGIDDSDGLFQSIVVPAVARDDSVTLPNGCRIYAILISGYANNNTHTDIPFFKVAEFVAKHGGYFHVGWWNNFHKEYAAGPLHPENITIRPLFGEDEVIFPSPATDFDPLAFAPSVTSNLLDRPKANPDDDFQFQSDAELVIQAIRAHNPDAIIMVAGHSMGGNAVARLGMSSTLRQRNVRIDLLAPIDPVGNRDKPQGIPGSRTFNWTRWRVANDFRGWGQRDCVRNALGLCRDFDPRLFHVSFRCLERVLDVRPLVGSRAPLVCPRLLPRVVTGPRPTIGPNITHLYHRWQHEFFWPVDFPSTERFNHSQPLSSSVLGPNYQEPVLPNLDRDSLDPNKTCPFGEPLFQEQAPDPRDPETFTCASNDGHGEIIGHRGDRGEFRPGLKMQGDWPSSDIPKGVLKSADRRAKMIELATADASWPHRPQNPELCMVCDDMITILQHLLEQQPQPPGAVDETAPVSLAIASPVSNQAGWNNEDVVVDITAVDEQNGSGVKEIETSLSGAQFGGMVTAGSVAQETVTAEGQTIVTYFARDNEGNAETGQMLNVWLDKAPPEIEAVPDPAPNAFGWNNSDVTVSFTASDVLSGLAGVSPTEPVLVTEEGADQEIIGTATDLADNQASAGALVSLDKTAPEVAGTPDRAPDSNGWYNHTLTVSWQGTDALSGIQACTAPTNYNGPDSATALVSGTCFDFAENEGNAKFDFQFDATPPGINITTPADGAIYLLNATVNSAFDCTDNLSGVDSCVGPVANGAAIDTATVNDKQFTVDSSDVAANHASRTHSYSVHYAFSGFMSPVRSLPVVKAGRTVPIKYRLQDANGVFISDLGSFVSLQSAPIACDAGAPSNIVGEEAVASGGTVLRYDATSNQFIYNWATASAWTGCRVLQLTLNDGSQHLALFQFK